MTGEVIKSFLVGLGFDVDDSSLKKFNQSIASATLKVAALYGSIKVASAGIGLAVSKISEDFEKMGYEYRIIAPAINKALVLRRELLKAYSAAGINITKVIQNSVKLNFSLAKTKFALEAIYKSVGSRFFGLLTQQSDAFRKKLYANLPQIQSVLERIIKFVFKAFEATVELGTRLGSILGRVYDFFVSLDKATDGWSTRILGVIAAWKLLNLGFLATPFGLIITGLTALLALWDDFKTFKEGGKSLIDWGSQTTQIMIGLVGVIGSVAAAIGSVIVALRALAIAQGIVNAVMLLNPVGLLVAGFVALLGALIAIDAKWKVFSGNLSGFFSGIGEKIMNFAGAPNVASNVGAGAQGAVPGVKPLGSNVTQGAQNNQNVQQQTNINVMGSADAQSVGKQVSSEQSKVNFDLVRNLKGATR